MALMMASVQPPLVGVWSITAIFLGVLIVYATTQPEKVRTLLGGAVAALGLLGIGLWTDMIFYCPDCCGIGGWFLCWWM